MRVIVGSVKVLDKLSRTSCIAVYTTLATEQKQAERMQTFAYWTRKCIVHTKETTRSDLLKEDFESTCCCCCRRRRQELRATGEPSQRHKDADDAKKNPRQCLSPPIQSFIHQKLGLDTHSVTWSHDSESVWLGAAIECRRESSCRCYNVEDGEDNNAATQWKLVSAAVEAVAQQVV